MTTTKTTTTMMMMMMIVVVILVEIVGLVEILKKKFTGSRPRSPPSLEGLYSPLS